MKDKKRICDRVPPISETLLKVLDEKFPEKCHAPELPYSEMCRRTGQRETVRFLHEIYRQQNER